jgi:ribosomal protein S18 acetylase RimI-like enzyme
MSYAQRHTASLDAYLSGVHASGINTAIVHTLSPALKTEVKSCFAFFEAARVPWALVLPEYLRTPSVEAVLDTAGLIETGHGVAMALSLENFQSQKRPSPLVIKTMNADLPHWQLPLIEAFDSTPEITSVYTARHAQASEQSQNFHHFSGVIDEHCVCSLTLSMTGALARLDDIATLPAYQRQGYATQLISHALQVAANLDIKQCFLEASESGLSIYKKMGFSSLFTNYYYECSAVSI